MSGSTRNNTGALRTHAPSRIPGLAPKGILRARKEETVNPIPHSPGGPHVRAGAFAARPRTSVVTAETGRTAVRNAKETMRLLIVDDHFLIRQGLKLLLTESFENVTCADVENGQQAMEAIWSKEWDVVLLDISMPGRGGLEVLRDIKHDKPDLPVIMLSMHDEDQFAIRAIQRGASAYISKNTAGSELVRAINAVCNGVPYITSTLATKLAQHIHEDRSAAAHEALTDREYQVMCLIAKGGTVKEIGHSLSLSVKTVSTYRARILDKLDVKNNSQIICYALKHHLVELDAA